MRLQEAKEKYPYAMRLDEALRNYSRTCSRLDERKDLAPLGAGLRLQVQRAISDGIRLQWSTDKLKGYVEKLGMLALDFQDQVPCSLPLSAPRCLHPIRG